MKPGVFFAKLRRRKEKLFTKSSWNIIVELVRANFKVIDHNSVLGVIWSLVNPIALFIVMYAVFSSRFGQDIQAYPLYLVVGIIPINFFIVATTYLIRVFDNNRIILLNTTVPRESVIVSSLFIHFYKFLIEFVICAILSMVYGLLKWQFFVFVVPLILAFVGFILGVGMLLALFFCFARDVEHIWTLVARLLLFVTPVFYSLDGISSWARAIVFWGNPLTHFLISFRGIFMGGLDMSNYLCSLVLGSVFFIAGYSAFIVFEYMSVERA